MWNRLPYRWKRTLVDWKFYFSVFFRKLFLRYRFFLDELYEFNRIANPWLHYFSIFLILAVFASLLLPVLFPERTDYLKYTELIDQILLIGFGSFYYLRLFLTTDRKTFLLSRWPEGIAATLALFFGLNLWLADGSYLRYILYRIGVPEAQATLVIIIQLYLLFLVTIKVVQVIPDIIARNTNPARLVLISFLSVIAVGMLLLMLPAATAEGAGLAFIDALFMATSAVCVTGLIVVDTATHLSFFGQGVILVLIQLGGIGIITFATFLAMYLTGGLGLAERNVLQDMISGEEVQTVVQTLKRIVLLTFSVEAIGFLGYFFGWSETIPHTGERAWFALFHAISAFCNAGFSIYTNSLADPVNAFSIPINITTMILIVIGGLGFTTIWECINRVRRKNPQKRFSVHSIIVLRMTAILIIAGFFLVLLVEWNGVLSGLSWGDKILFSMFQSVTSRTAGFNTLDTGILSAGTTLIVIVLMTIGGSPSSTAGGLKTTTVYILFTSMIANIQGKERIEIANRTIPDTVLYRAITSVLLAVLVITTGLILLTILEDFAFMDILFEQISAFMTVGLSRGITGDLSDPGKLVIIVSMFAGRVGMLTVAVAFAHKVLARNYRYPEESVMVA